MKPLHIVLFSSALAFATACGGSDDKPANTASSPTPFAQQVTRGTDEYAEHCASCHGSAGEGTEKAPPLVGSNALPLNPPSGARVRQTQFVTVADVAQFVTKNMPGDAPGSLSADEYFAILAFDLHENGIDLDQRLDAQLAASLTIPRN